MPAQSPTLSQTLSAITAGLRGSSSGMPASTFPTRAAPTSAPLVKMPPPRRGENEKTQGPEEEAGEDRDQRGAEGERDHRLEDLLHLGVGHRPAQDRVVDADAEQAEPDHQH